MIFALEPEIFIKDFLKRVDPLEKQVLQMALQGASVINTFSPLHRDRWIISTLKNFLVDLDILEIAGQLYSAGKQDLNIAPPCKLSAMFYSENSLEEAWQKGVQMGVVKDIVDMIEAAIAAEVQEQPVPEPQESIVTESQEDTGEDILTAESIPRKRMDLLWVGGEEELELLETAVRAQSEVEVMLGTEQGGPKTFTVTQEDIEWAKSIDKVIAKADEASDRKDYATAIKYYEEVLKVAPGTDLYLMSLGSCYAMSGQIDKGLQYLKRAHEISPNNQRINRNLQKLEQVIAYHS